MSYFGKHCKCSYGVLETQIGHEESRLVDAPKGEILAEIELDARIGFQCTSSQRYLPSSILRSALARYRSHELKAMVARHSLLYSLSSLFLILPLSWALKFDLEAHTGHHNKYERCIRNFVAKETLVLVTAIVDGQKGDGQMVNMHVSLPPQGD